MQTLLVNLYGAPCSGKSVKMMQLAVEGKLRGVFCEISAEVAKEYVVQGVEITPEVQWALTREQVRRLKCFVGNVAVLVTDAPVLIGAFYARYRNLTGVKEMETEFGMFDEEIRGRAERVVNVYMWRDHAYEEAGRLQCEAEDEEIAREMWAFVRERHEGQVLLEAKSTEEVGALWERIMRAGGRG